MSESRVSVILPVYNGERYLREALQSIADQTYPAYECLVIDDGSTDATEQIARSFAQVTYIQQPNSGAASARNNGITRATGDLIAFLDSDDTWLPDKLTRQIAALAESPSTDAVFGMIEQFYSPEVSDELKAKIYCTPAPVPGYLPSAFLARAGVFKRVGLLNATLRSNEFIEWYARAQDCGMSVKMLPQIITRRRLHSLNQRAVKPDSPAGMVDMLKSVLDRRRAT